MRNEPPTGDELTRLLTTMKASVLQQAMDSPQPARPAKHSQTRRRVIGIVIAVIALLGIGTAGGALAAGIIPSPFGLAPTPTLTPTPTSTPTPTPTPAPPPPPTVAAPDYSAPIPTVPIDCAALSPEDSLGFLITEAKLLNSGEIWSPDGAALRQAGALSCFWGSDTPGIDGFGLLSTDVSSYTVAGQDEVATRLSDGATSLGVGDASAVSCNDGTQSGCTVSVVVGDYWIEFHYQGQHQTDADIQQLVGQLAQQMAGVLLQAGPPGPAWVMPSNSWTPVTGSGCDAFATSTPIPELIGVPGMTPGPPPARGTINGISWAADADYYGCTWSVPQGVAVPPDQFGSLTVALVPGARWAYQSLTGDESPADVPGAQAATYSCVPGDGAHCILSVLTDDSWLQVSVNSAEAPAQPLIDVAAAIIAAHGQP